MDFHIIYIPSPPPLTNGSPALLLDPRTLSEISEHVQDYLHILVVSVSNNSELHIHDLQFVEGDLNRRQFRLVNVWKNKEQGTYVRMHPGTYRITHPQKTFSPPVVLLSCDSRSIQIRLDCRAKYGKVRVGKALLRSRSRQQTFFLPRSRLTLENGPRLGPTIRTRCDTTPPT